MPRRHGLGLGNGTIIEYEDGTAGYRASGTLTQAFRVAIGDVTGFSVAKSGKMLERQLSILGHGTLLASVSVNHGTSEKIESWFQQHPRFGGRGAVATSGDATGPPLIADELSKLAALRSEGVLTEQEFAAQKAKLLSR